jgi:hypothetical protein
MTESLKQITVYSILNFFGQNHIILTLICHNHVCREEAHVIGYLVAKIGYMILFYIFHTFSWVNHSLTLLCNRFWRFTNHLPTSTNQSYHLHCMHSFFSLFRSHFFHYRKWQGCVGLLIQRYVTDSDPLFSSIHCAITWSRFTMSFWFDSRDHDVVLIWFVTFLFSMLCSCLLIGFCICSFNLIHRSILYLSV